MNIEIKISWVMAQLTRKQKVDIVRQAEANLLCEQSPDKRDNIKRNLRIIKRLLEFDVLE